MSSRLTLPCTSHGLGFVWYVLECLNLFRHVHKLEMAFTGSASVLNSIEFDLEVFEFEGKITVFVVEVTVVVDLMGKGPVIVDEESIV